MRAVKNNLPAPSGKVGASESPRWMRAVGDQPAHPLKKTKRRKKKEPCQSPLSCPRQSQLSRSADRSPRQGPDSPLGRDQWIKSHLRGICGAPSLHAIHSCQRLNDLLPESSPAGCTDVAAGEGACRERHDLVDLAAGDFYFYGGVEEIG